VCCGRLSSTAAGDTLMHYLAGLLAGTRQFSEASSERLDADITALEAFFAQYLKPDKVVIQCATCQIHNIVVRV
jgi:hypothetical protein